MTALMGVVCLRPCLMRAMTVLCVVGGRKRTVGRVIEVRLLSFLLGCSLGGMRDELSEVVCTQMSTVCHKTLFI